jgi:DNA (cytosine-5)-methyltransferase 1
MNYLSVCSGIEAATVAWHHMGWKAVGYSEIEKFPSEVLAHHYPDVPNFGDMTQYKDWNINGTVGLLVGGTPCQSFSVAGLRKGLEDPRGNLALTYVGILDRFRPKWFIWENVPGVLSSNKGRDFGSFLGALVELGYGWSYRVLDAQHFGVAQRRRRVFVVGHLGDWKPTAKVLFESESLSGNIKQSRKERKEVTRGFVPSIANCLQTTCNDYSRADGFNMIAEPTISFDERNIQFFSEQNYKTCPTLTATDHKGAKSVLTPIHCVDKFPTLLSSTAGVSRPGNAVTEHQTYIAYALQGAGSTSQNNHGSGYKEEQSFTLNRTDVHGVAHAFKIRGGSGNGGKGYLGSDEKAFTISCGQDQQIFQQMAVRRLTPVECERLQGFPDNYTNIKENCPDGPRYKALGNSMAVPVMRWIGERINKYENGNL